MERIKTMLRGRGGEQKKVENREKEMHKLNKTEAIKQ